MTRALRVWIGFSAVLLAALAFCAWRLPAGYTAASLGNVVQTVLPLLLAGTMGANAIIARGRARVFWAVAMGGATLWFAANAMWTHYEVVLRQPVPVPFIGDVLFFLHIVPFTAALAVRPHRNPSEQGMEVGSIDFLMLLSWWVYLYLFLVIPWQYVILDPQVYAVNFNLLYTVENALMVAGCGVLCVRAKGPWFTTYLHLFGASALYLAGSQLVNNAITRNVYYTGSVYDLPLVASMCWLVGLSLHGLRLRAKPMEGAGTKWHGIVMARLAMVATVSMPIAGLLGMFVFRAKQHEIVVFRICVTLGALIVLPFLLFLKQHMLDRQLVCLLRISEHDLDMQKRLQAQLVQTEKLSSLADLVAGAAHEINNPLTAVLGYADLLQRDASLMPHTRGFAKKIAEQGRRTKELVNDLLKFGQQVPATKELIDLNAVLINAVDLRKLDLEPGIRIEQQLERNLPAVFADPNHMLQVCFQLIGNAVEALGEAGGGTLIVSTRSKDGNLVMEFRDNGPGVKDPKKIFDPFYTTKPVGKGTGLGLSAAYGIVREHGGMIACDNNESGGAIFRVLLPFTPPTPRPAPLNASFAATAR
jgi:signal transduction histidine kinase